MRIIITGPPGSGKTTLAELLSKILDIGVLHTDSTQEMDWSAASQEVSGWLSVPGPWIIEGVVVPRAIRKWKARHNEGVEPPWDRLIVLRNPRIKLLLQGQRTMAKTVLELIDSYKEWSGKTWLDL